MRTRWVEEELPAQTRLFDRCKGVCECRDAVASSRSEYVVGVCKQRECARPRLRRRVATRVDEQERETNECFDVVGMRL